MFWIFVGCSDFFVIFLAAHWQGYRSPPNHFPYDSGRFTQKIPCRHVQRVVFLTAKEVQNHSESLGFEPLSRWWFQIFVYVQPYLGKWSNLTNIFQMGWNHQLVFFSGSDSKKIVTWIGEENMKKYLRKFGVLKTRAIFDHTNSLVTRKYEFSCDWPMFRCIRLLFIMHQTPPKVWQYVYDLNNHTSAVFRLDFLRMFLQMCFCLAFKNRQQESDDFQKKLCCESLPIWALLPASLNFSVDGNGKLHLAAEGNPTTRRAPETLTGRMGR